jgi:preprotein translocase SecE subunit
MTNSVKRFFKELKRVRWIKSKVLAKNFITVIIFVIISSLILFSVTLLFTSIWTQLGVGIDGKAN